MASTIPVKVVSIIDGAPDIKVFEFETVDGTTFPVFEPGSHVDLHITSSLIRQYSSCGRPDDRRLRLAIKLEAESRGGSRHAHRELCVGDNLTVSQPRNNFEIAWSASHHILLAGGIGITPMLSMAYRMVKEHASFELHYFCRSAEHAVFADEITQAFGERARIYFANSDAVAETIEHVIATSRAGAHVYVCGPVGMIDLVAEKAGRLLPPEAFHHELFAARGEANDEADRPFNVVLARTGTTLTVPPGKSIAQVLRENGVDVPVSCEQGVCGTCLTGVIEGVPDHRDEVLSDTARASCSMIALCVSRSLTDELILDL
ncbi:PDR/VanB family oxidoreductase [Paraburkholderia sp. J41]|uniref:PDR/VanB family oxidoreductase n=1 Tax=Paraburkholderia sp. J41 TaxID=2805433 RepID=UPI002AC33E85|nr:PDR/VanB family oxidoreductase [Paraburkholderia sp. J41]